MDQSGQKSSTVCTGIVVHLGFVVFLRLDALFGVVALLDGLDLLDGHPSRPFAFPPQNDLLLFEVSSLFFVHQNQIQVIADRKLFVDIFHGWRQLIAGQEEPNRYGLAANGCAVHYLVFGDCLVLVERVLADACRLAFDDSDLHVLYFDPNQ